MMIKIPFILLVILPSFILSLLGVSFSSSFVFDDFNDNATDRARWQIALVGDQPSLAETNGRLEITLPADSKDALDHPFFGAGYISMCSLRGDFDLQTDYTLINWPLSNGVRVGLSLDSNLDVPREYDVQRISFGDNDFIGEPREAYLYGGGSGAVATTDRSGTLRIKRTRTQLTSFYMNGGNWLVLNNVSVPQTDLHFSLSAWSHSNVFTKQDVRVAFDNMTILQGLLVCPTENTPMTSPTEGPTETPTIPATAPSTLTPTITATPTETPQSAYLPFVSHVIPTDTPTPTFTPTSTATPTFTPTVTPTPNPKIPYPYDNDPKQIAFTKDDVPVGWIIQKYDYHQPEKDWKDKKLISAWESLFYRGRYIQPATLRATVYKYLRSEDAIAGFSRGIEYYNFYELHEVNWPPVAGADQSILFYGGESTYYQWSVLMIRKGNVRVDVELAWIDDPHFELTDTCARTELARITGTEPVICNIADYVAASSVLMQTPDLDNMLLSNNIEP